MKILCRKHNKALIGIDERNQELIEKLKDKVYNVEVKKARNYKFHCKLFALFGMIIENSDLFTGMSKGIAEKHLLQRVKMNAGHVDILEISGVKYKVPSSISFKKMSEDEFQDFYNSAIEALLRDKDLGIDNKVILEFVE